MLVSFGLSMLPVIGLLAFFINPVLFGGLAYTFSRRIRGENPCGRRCLQRVQPGVSAARAGRPGVVAAHLRRPAAVRAAGIYLAVGYTFALPLVIDKKYDFWTRDGSQPPRRPHPMVDDVRSADRRCS